MSVSLTFSNEELTATAGIHLDHRRSVQERKHRLAENMLSKKEDVEGGERLYIPFDYQRHSDTKQLPGGYEAIPLAGRPILTPGNEGWFFCARPVMISLRDEMLNRGKQQIIDKLKKRITDTENGLLAEYEDQNLRANVTEMSDLRSLNGDDDSNGFLEAAATGTNTVHGVAKTTYNTLPGVNNQWYDGGGSFSTSGLIGMYAIMNRIRDLVDSDEDVHIYMSLNGADHYKRAVQGQERYVTQLDAGRLAEVFQGRPITVTSRLPNAGTATTAAPWTALFLDHSTIKFRGQKGYVMQMTDFRDVGTHLVRAAFFLLAGQNAVNDFYFGSSGILTDAEAW